MIDLDFVLVVKRSFFFQGSQKVIDIMDVMLGKLYIVIFIKRFFENIRKIKDKVESFFFVFMKGMGDFKNRNVNFVIMKFEGKLREKMFCYVFKLEDEKICVKILGEYFIKEGLILWYKNQ